LVAEDELKTGGRVLPSDWRAFSEPLVEVLARGESIFASTPGIVKEK
jgi:hypothetical protein